MNAQTIQAQIDAFPRWHYQFDLAGHLTPIFDRKHIQRHIERKHYFFDPLVQLYGGSLQGKRVLDLGCNAGFWSLAAAEAGCEYVLGIDGRQMHIDQARFVFEVKGIEQKRYDFVLANLQQLNLKDYGTFDVVLFLGLMYHLDEPMHLLSQISEVNQDLLVIDTQLSLAPGSQLTVFHEPLDEPRNAVDRTIVLHPTRQAVLDMVQSLGYNAVVLRPQFSSYAGAIDYRLRFRRAFLCSKSSNLESIQAAVEPYGVAIRGLEMLLEVGHKAYVAGQARLQRNP